MLLVHVSVPRHTHIVHEHVPALRQTIHVRLLKAILLLVSSDLYQLANVVDEEGRCITLVSTLTFIALTEAYKGTAQRMSQGCRTPSGSQLPLEPGWEIGQSGRAFLV